MNEHTAFLRLAATAIDFPLQPADEKALAAHIQGCGACRRAADALRADATGLRSLPRRSPSPRVADAITRGGRGEAPTRPPLMTLGLGFLLAAVLVGGVVGAVVLRGTLFQDRLPAPSPKPSEATIVEPLPSAQPSLVDPRLGIEWQVVTPEGDDSSGTSANAVTAYGQGFVSVGRTCRPDPAGGEPLCWGGVQLSPDGFTWEIVPRQPGLEIGTYYPTSGPGADLIGVAAGPDTVITIGYALDGGAPIGLGGVLRPAVWVSSDARTWERTPDDAVFEGARFSDVVASDAGFVIVGAVYGPGAPQGAPRGAIWTSDDGRAWRRVPDGAIFDIGGYQDTGEDPGSGGPRRVTAVGGALLSVGAVCSAQGRDCRAAFWSSQDGTVWERVVLDEPNLIASDIAVTAGGFVAVGMTSNAGGCSPDLRCTAVVLTSADGRVWIQKQVVEIPEGLIAPDSFTDVVVVGGGMIAVAVEFEDDGLPEGGRQPQLWRSPDGSTWIPVEGIPDEFSPGYQQPIAVGPDRVVIVGDIHARILVSPPN